MRHQIKILMLCLFLFPCSAFACLFSYCVGDSFRQPGIDISNHSSQEIIFTDANGSTVVTPKNCRNRYEFPSDLVTNTTKQTFSHTFDIRSAVDFKLICTIKTNAVITDGAANISKSISTDESKCHVPHYVVENFDLGEFVDVKG